MPRVIELVGSTGCDPDDCIAALAAQGFDPHEEESLLHAARWLRRLGNNRHFLAEIMLDELRERHRDDESASTYGP